MHVTRILPNDSIKWSFGNQKFVRISSDSSPPDVDRQDQGNAPADSTGSSNSQNGISSPSNADTDAGKGSASDRAQDSSAETSKSVASRVEHHGSNQNAQKIGVTGQVLDQDGNPLNGVQIRVKSGSFVEQAVTDNGGNYRVHVPDKGNYNLSAEHEGFESYDIKITVPDMRNYAVDHIQLVPMSSSEEHLNSNEQLHPAPAARPQVNSYFITIAPTRQSEYWVRLGWVVAGLGIVAAFVLQLRTWLKRLLSPNLSSVIYNLKAALVNLENAVNSPEPRPTNDLDSAEKLRKSAAASTEPSVPEDDGTAEPVIKVGSGGYAPIFPDPPERPVPRTLVELYEHTRTAPDQERAIQDFRRDHSFTRLSLINADDVEVNPNVSPEFAVSSAGWFLGVESDGQMLCFPWFSLDFSHQIQTFQKAFNFQGNGSLRVTSAARLSPNGKTWTLTDRGRIESEL